MKRMLSFVLAVAMVLPLAACGAEQEAAAGIGAAEAPGAEPVTIQVAAVETGYGTQVWRDVAAAFEAQTGIRVELILDKDLETVLSGALQKGHFPDVVHLPTGRPAGLTEQLIRANALQDLTHTLSLTIPGESVKVSEKLAGGFADNKITSPYGDGKTYLAPMFYSPCGLFYNAALFREKGWSVPTTWEEMWTLGDRAAAEGIALFTYPSVDYYDAFLFALINAVGGPEFFRAITGYEAGAWDSDEGRRLLSILDQLASYTHPSTPGHANNRDFVKNQLLVMTNEALFMPNGIWITGEMAGVPQTLDHAFAWGMTAIPSAGAAPYAFCWFEEAWIPKAAAHIPEAEQFVAFLYSDKAAQLFASAGAMQPIVGMGNLLEGEEAMFYSLFDGGARAAAGGFAAFGEIPGVTISGTFLAPMDALVEGTITIQDYAARVKGNSAMMAAARLG